MYEAKFMYGLERARYDAHWLLKFFFRQKYKFSTTNVACQVTAVHQRRDEVDIAAFFYPLKVPHYILGVGLLMHELI